MTLFYLPLENYRERYTMQWSAPKTGWQERNWVRTGVDYVRIDPDNAQEKSIRSGAVLDAVGRSQFCFRQISTVLEMLESGKIKTGDVIYMDDFWTPGFEAIPYACHLLNIHPRIYSYLHAQSCDEFDFTHSMRNWMRHYERGIAEAHTGIFVGAPILKDLLHFGGVCDASKIHVVGHPFSSEEVLGRMPELDSGCKQNRVVFSSRWDSEKNPDFFLKVAANVIGAIEDVEFVVCTSTPKLRSNCSHLLVLLQQYMRSYPNNIILKEGLSKEEYYDELAKAKIQFNSASQDFISVALLEASVAECYPIYPYFRSFPEVFLDQSEFMYERNNVRHATEKVIEVLERDDLWTPEAVKKRDWIHKRYDYSWLRMLRIMGVEAPKATDEEMLLSSFDPYYKRAWLK